MDKKEINKDISVLHLVCYLDNKTDKLLWIEQYEDNNSENIQTNKYKHDYNDRIVKTEELINQMDADYEYYTQELKTLRSIIKNKEKRNAELFVMCNKYRKVLKDIEKISHYGTFKCVYCDGKNSCITFKILDIISKAKDGKDE